MTIEPHASTQAASSTPAARWRVDGNPDPHGKRYDCERAATIMGNLSDDELANAMYLCDHRRSLDSIGFLTAAKDRIRWLSRALERALASASDVSPIPLVWEPHGQGAERTVHPFGEYVVFDDGSVVGCMDGSRKEADVAAAKEIAEQDYLARAALLLGKAGRPYETDRIPAYEHPDDVAGVPLPGYGPLIRTDGNRPDWIDDEEIVARRLPQGPSERKARFVTGRWAYDFRVRADHPYYETAKG